MQKMYIEGIYQDGVKLRTFLGALCKGGTTLNIKFNKNEISIYHTNSARKVHILCTVLASEIQHYYFSSRKYKDIIIPIDLKVLIEKMCTRNMCVVFKYNGEEVTIGICEMHFVTPDITIEGAISKCSSVSEVKVVKPTQTSFEEPYFKDVPNFKIPKKIFSGSKFNIKRNNQHTLVPREQGIVCKTQTPNQTLRVNIGSIGQLIYENDVKVVLSHEEISMIMDTLKIASDSTIIKVFYTPKKFGGMKISFQMIDGIISIWIIPEDVEDEEEDYEEEEDEEDE